MAEHRASGAVTRLYVSKDVTHIRLQIPEAEQPKDNYFHLRQSHSNYNALYSLALSAAINGYTLSIRTVGEISPTQDANVHYMYVDW
jgi:hypothetical protein